MIPYEIETKDGYLIMDDLPHNCIFNKVVTGCGGSTIALRNNENYVIAVPTTELIINKLYPSIDFNGNSIDVDNIDKKAGLNPSVNLFGLFGQKSLSLNTELISYLKQDGVKKIMCTYDKLPSLNGIINPKDYRLLIDEYHCLLKSYAYRSIAINGIFDVFRGYKSFCFMSATAIFPNFKPMALEGITEYIADWKDIEGLKIVPYQTNKPYNLIAKIIHQYKKHGAIKMTGNKSTEAYIFINSVADIVSILKYLELSPDECRIICADNDKNKKKLGIYKISSSIDTPKMFNFITSKSFEGVDFYSESGICFVVSNVHSANTLLDIATDVPQIAGRIRTKTNPFRKTVVHIFNTKRFDADICFEELVKSQNEQLEYAKERIDGYNSLSYGAKQQRLKEMKKSTNQSYIHFDKSTAKFILNDILSKYELYIYCINNLIYANKNSLQKYYRDQGAKVTKVKWEKIDESAIKRIITKKLFKDVFNEYAELRQLMFSFDDSQQKEIEEDYPFIKNAFNKLGIEEVKKLKYNQKAIKNKLVTIDQDKKADDKVFSLLKLNLTMGTFYSNNDLVTMIEKAIENLNIKTITIIKAAHIKKWFDAESSAKRINGQVTRGYTINNPLIIYTHKKQKV
ncbi:hypothetical protein [Dysgonomonas sp. HGC4]|uniref:hypothetical protein n=1 Tax=Dysgonomonas sp. HGC4 TaxID=1658009 RepID=UPI000A7802E0|nr:hypothetical protein [Dysgonomonas sp. HGC4]MBD8348795.1 hypothetical protein [Dysgonomonas sp. HGC4]